MTSGKCAFGQCWGTCLTNVFLLTFRNPKFHHTLQLTQRNMAILLLDMSAIRKAVEHNFIRLYFIIIFSNGIFSYNCLLHVLGTVVSNWWGNGDQQIAFCREGKGFIAFNDQ